MVIQQIASQAIKVGSRYVARSLYTALRVQDRIIDKSYRKAGLYNRGLVKGIKHGLVGGQVIGGLLGLGLPEGVEPGTFQKRPSSGSKYQKHKRVQRYSSKRYKYCRPRYSRRRR